MLGQPVAMVIPEVVGFGFKGKLREGVTATDLVLTCTQMLRKRGVVEKFVEYYGEGLDHLSVEDRATIGNMAPEYGATCGFFPVDADTIKYLKATGRSAERVALVEAYCKAQGHVARGRRPAGLHRHAGARPLHRRALDGGAEAAAGPRAAHPGQGGLRRRAARYRQGRRPEAPQARWTAPASTSATAMW